MIQIIKNEYNALLKEGENKMNKSYKEIEKKFSNAERNI